MRSNSESSPEHSAPCPCPLKALPVNRPGGRPQWRLRKHWMAPGLVLFFSSLFLICPSLGNCLAPLHFDGHLSSQYHDDLPGLIKKRYIRILTTVNRTNFFIDNGHLVGYEYALLKDYEAYLNKHINDQHLQVALEFIPVARDELIPNLVQGLGDIAAAGLTITPDRQAKVAFTAPYLTGIDEIVVTHSGSTGLNDVFDLSGKTVFVRKSSSYYQSLRALNTELQRLGREEVHLLLAPEELETEDILELVNFGAVSITVADSHIAEAWAQVFDHITLHPDITLRTGSEIAWMVRRNNPKLLASLNDFLKTHKQGTLRGNMYFKRYYKDARKLTIPKDIDAWVKIKPFKGIMKQYAERYGFDWLLILAMAYQESGLDHSKRNQSGALGLMQILPSTARDERIGIDNVTDLKNNIRAGVKYLALIRDEYFSSEAIHPRDQVRLALAAYNAGPAKIQKARRLAEKMGLNPNIWFRHVELAVLQLIGRETVQYVNNINKYVVLYRILERQKSP